MSEIKVGDWIEITGSIGIRGVTLTRGIKVGEQYEVQGVHVVSNDVVLIEVILSDGTGLNIPKKFVKKAKGPVEPPKLKDVPKAINSAVSKFEMLARSYAENLSGTLVAKNADYGNSFEKSYEKHGLVSAVIRLEDKLNRLESLVKNEAKVSESIDDTLLDIAGYAILTLIARSGNHDDNQ